jgi:hypothetical protein
MRIVKSRIYVMQVVLLVFATALTLIGFLFPHQDVTLWPSIWGYVVRGQDQYPIVLGVVSFTQLSYFIGFLFLYLSFEFYGFKNGFYGTLALALMMTVCYFALGLLRDISGDPRTAVIDRRILMFFELTRREFVAGLVSFLGAYTLIFALATLVKKLTHDYFMFLRYTIAALTGFAVYVAAQVFLNNAGSASFEDMMVTAVTPAAQFAILVVASVIPLYLMRLFLGIFRGTSPTEPSAHTAPDGSRSDTENPESGGWFGTFVFLPLFFGTVAGGLIRAAIEAFNRDLFPDAPLFIIDGTEAPNDYAIHYAIVVAVTLFCARLAFFVTGKLMKRRKERRSSAVSTVSAGKPPEEDTVSEKLNPFHKTA